MVTSVLSHFAFFTPKISVIHTLLVMVNVAPLYGTAPGVQPVHRTRRGDPYYFFGIQPSNGHPPGARSGTIAGALKQSALGVRVPPLSRAHLG